LDIAGGFVQICAGHGWIAPSDLALDGALAPAGERSEADRLPIRPPAVSQ
jgi:hypothetical protein